MIKGCGHPLTLTRTPKPLPHSKLCLHCVFWTQQVMVEEQDEIFFRASWSRGSLFPGFRSISDQMDSVEKMKGWTKIFEVTLLKKAGKHICEDKATFGNYAPLFWRRALETHRTLGSVSILEALAPTSHVPRDQERWELFSLFPDLVQCRSLLRACNFIPRFLRLPGKACLRPIYHGSWPFVKVFEITLSHTGYPQRSIFEFFPPLFLKQ